MADFCRSCTIELFGDEFADRNDMLRPSMADDEMALDLCEHCGPGWFDRDGIRVVPHSGPTLDLEGATARQPEALVKAITRPALKPCGCGDKCKLKPGLNEFCRDRGDGNGPQ